MSWNYRVVRRNYGDNVEEYGIHEVYYFEGDRLPTITEKAANVWDEDIAGLKWRLEEMREALSKPVIDYNTREEI